MAARLRWAFFQYMVPKMRATPALMVSRVALYSGVRQYARRSFSRQMAQLRMRAPSVAPAQARRQRAALLLALPHGHVQRSAAASGYFLLCASAKRLRKSTQGSYMTAAGLSTCISMYVMAAVFQVPYPGLLQTLATHYTAVEDRSEFYSTCRQRTG